MEGVVETTMPPQETNTQPEEYEMNGRWNSNGMFYDGKGVYFFSDPRGQDPSNTALENVLNYVYQTADFITFKKAEPTQTYYQQNYMQWDFNIIHDTLRTFEESMLEKVEVLAFNEYRNMIYYSVANKLFTYDLHTQQYGENPIVEAKGYDIVGINICGEKLVLSLVLEEQRDFRGYFSNFGGAATYVANLDGSDLREVIIPQCTDTIQTFSYESQGFGISVPSYWYICTDEGSYYGSLLMIIAPHYDFFMTSGKSEYAKMGYMEDAQKIECKKIETKQGLSAEYTVYRGINENGEKDLFGFSFSVSKGEQEYYFAVVGDFKTIEELKPIFINIAENFEIL